MTPYEGYDATALARTLCAPRCLLFDSVTSTLDVVHEVAAGGAPAGTVVLADEQVSGRGRRGRIWHSPPGVGVWLGYLARPTKLGAHGVMALRVGLALNDALQGLGVESQLKWPNDLLVRDRKLGGILCEGRWRGSDVSWVAIGVGINVHGPLPVALAGRAIPLDEVLPDVSRMDLLVQFVPRLHTLPDESALTDAEQAAFQRYDWLRGRAVRHPVTGRATGIDREGALLIETDVGVMRVRGGHVVSA